jgi:hypothetical protein
LIQASTDTINNQQFGGKVSSSWDDYKKIYDRPKSMLTIIVREKNVTIIQDLAQQAASVLADKVFIFSKQDINITANLKFNQETYTCSYSEK